MVSRFPVRLLALTLAAVLVVVAAPSALAQSTEPGEDVYDRIGRLRRELAITRAELESATRRTGTAPNEIDRIIARGTAERLKDTEGRLQQQLDEALAERDAPPRTQLGRVPRPDTTPAPEPASDPLHTLADLAGDVVDDLKARFDRDWLRVQVMLAQDAARRAGPAETPEARAERERLEKELADAEAVYARETGRDPVPPGTPSEPPRRPAPPAGTGEAAPEPPAEGEGTGEPAASAEGDGATQQQARADLGTTEAEEEPQAVTPEVVPGIGAPARRPDEAEQPEEQEAPADEGARSMDADPGIGRGPLACWLSATACPSAEPPTGLGEPKIFTPEVPGDDVLPGGSDLPEIPSGEIFTPAPSEDGPGTGCGTGAFALMCGGPGTKPGPVIQPFPELPSMFTVTGPVAAPSTSSIVVTEPGTSTEVEPAESLFGSIVAPEPVDAPLVPPPCPELGTPC